MTACGKHGKTIKLFSHPSHKPWKSLRDSHIPSAPQLIISIQFSNPKRSLSQLPNPLTFRLIFQLEKTEGKKIYLVTMAALYSCNIAQGSDYRCGGVLTQSSWTELGRCFYCGHFHPRISGISAGRINLLKCYFACYRFVREPGNGCRVTDASPAIAEVCAFNSARPAAVWESRCDSDLRYAATGLPRDNTRKYFLHG
jgi:hypothetical protein